MRRSVDEKKGMNDAVEPKEGNMNALALLEEIEMLESLISANVRPPGCQV